MVLCGKQSFKLETETPEIPEIYSLFDISFENMRIKRNMEIEKLLKLCIMLQLQ